MRRMAVRFAGATALIISVALIGSANAQIERGPAALSGQIQNFTPVEKAACGPHWGRFLTGPEIRKMYTTDDRPPVEQLVHSLEHGYTILWYDETLVDDDDAIDELEALGREFPSTTDFNDKFMAAPWTSDDCEAFPDGAHVALTHWSMGGTNGNPDGQQGIWEYCSKLSGEVVGDFMKDYPYSDSPEPTST